MFIVERNAQSWEVVWEKKNDQKRNSSTMRPQVQISLPLKQQLFNLLLDGLNLRLDLRALILGDTGSNDRSADTTSSAERLLGPDEHVGDVLVLAEQRDVEQDLQGLRVCRHHDKLRLSSVQSLGGLVGSLPQLFVVGGLLDQIQYLGGQRLVSEWVGLGVDFFRHDDDVGGVGGCFISSLLSSPC